MQKNTSHFYFPKIFQTGLFFKILLLAALICIVPYEIVKAEDPPPDVNDVTFWLRSGPVDYIWGLTEVGEDYITVTLDSTPLFTVQADLNGYWQNTTPIEITPGDIYTISADTGLSPVVVEIPNPFTVHADSETDEVWGHIQGWPSMPVDVYGDWPGGYKEIYTDWSDNFSTTFADIPYGGQGYIIMDGWVGTDIHFRQEFRTPDLVLETNYSYDWVQGHYDAGHTVWLTVHDNYGAVKATAEVETGPIPQWFGGSGFFTDMGDPWSPERPDIVPGDWIHGLVDNGYEAWLHIGTITGEGLDTGSDLISGTVDADWLLPGPVNVECYIWQDPGPSEQFDTVIPDGFDEFECSWNSIWDIMPGDHIQVAYFEPDGHVVMREFHEPAPYLKIEKWFIGEGSPGEGGNAAFYVQYINQGDAPAENVTITDTFEGMDYIWDTSGAAVDVGSDYAIWDLGTVDPGEWTGFTVYFDVTTIEGNLISNTVEIATTTFDQGDPSEKISLWEDSVAANDTHLYVNKEVWTFNPAPGEDYFYQVNVCNYGETGSSTLTLVETLPVDVSFNYWWSTQAGWSGVSQIGQTLELCNLSLPPGMCNEVYINVTLDEEAQPEDELVNTVEIDADNDLETEDNFAELHHTVGDPFIDMGIWQEWHSGILVPGGEYNLGIGYKNMGNVSISTPIEITATLDPDVYFKSSNVTPDSITATSVTWVIGSDLIAGVGGMIELQLGIDPGTSPETALTNIVDIDIPPGDVNPDNNHHVLDVLVRDHGLNLRVKKDGNWEGSEGQFAWWNIQVENIGDEVAEDLILTDYYPDEMELVEDIYVNYWGDWSWSDNTPEDNAFRVDLEGLAPGESMSIFYYTYVREEVTVIPGMQFSNIVEVPYDGDTNPADNVFETIIITSPGFSTFLPMILK